MLNINKFIEVPLINAFSEYDNVLSQLKNYGVDDNNNIYILCCSMMSCLICSDLKEINKKLHYWILVVVLILFLEKKNKTKTTNS